MNADKAKATARPEATPTAPVHSLGMKPERFRDRWNATVASLGNRGLRLPVLRVERGEVQDVFTVTLADGVMMLGSVNKADGSLREVSIGIEGGDKETAMVGLIAWALLVSAVNPSVASDEAGDVLRRLGLFDVEDLTDFRSDVTVGPVHYGVMTVASTLWLFASDADDR